MKPTLALALLPLLPACFSITVVQPRTGIPGAFDVAVTRFKGGDVRLEITNTSPDSLLVQRDAITLHDPRGVRARQQGGIAHQYVIPPGGHHAVNLRYDVGGLRSGDPIYVDFTGALVAGSQPLQIPPIQAVVD